MKKVKRESFLQVEKSELDRDLLFYNRLDDGQKTVLIKEDDRAMLAIYSNNEAYKSLKQLDVACSEDCRMARYGLLSTKEPLDFSETTAQFKELKQQPISSALPI